MKANEWIDQVKTRKGLPSDYAAAKALGISRFTVSGYRNRPEATLDEEIAFKVANYLGMSPTGIIIDQVAERTKNPVIRNALAKVAGELCILCKVSVTGFLMLAEKLAVVPRPLSHR